MKAAGDRRCRLHRIASVGRAARFGGDRYRHRLFHRLLRPSAEGSQPGDAEGPPGIHLRRGRAAGARPRGLPRRGHPRLPPGRPGRGPKELGTRFRRLYKEQRRGDSAAARSPGRHADPEIRIRVELVGLRRPRAAAHARRRVSAAAVARMACRSWPPSIWGISTGPTTACPPCRCGISRSTARDSGRIWDFSAF